MPNTRAAVFDYGPTVFFLVACETEVTIDVTTGGAKMHWPLALVVLSVGALTIPLRWRRRAPLGAASASLVGLVLLQLALPVESLNFAQFVLFLPPYSVAANSPQRRAYFGLAVCLVPVVAIDATGSTTLSSWTFSIGAVALSWAVGRLIRARRLMAAELEETTDRIAAERDALERLAVAEQRTKIAQELQTVVAESVSSMIVQAEAAKRLLNENLSKADAAMANIEGTGRAALSDMRRILGVLRHVGAEPDLAPIPGIGQVAQLIEGIRRPDRHVELRVEGDPRPVPASVDLTVYRLLEHATAAADLPDGSAIEVTLTFAAEFLELGVRISGACVPWPTPTMSDLTQLCDGRLAVEQVPGVSTVLTVCFAINLARIGIAT